MSAMKRNRVLIMWMMLENLMLSGRIQMPEVTYCMSQCISVVQQKRIHRDGKHVGRAWEEE